jgi:putative membrane protein
MGLLDQANVWLGEDGESSLAGDDRLPEFANYDVAEQTTMAEVLKDAGAESGKPDEKDAAIAKMLEHASGSAFDIEYLTGQIEGHAKLLKIQEDYIASGKDADHVGIAKLARGKSRSMSICSKRYRRSSRLSQVPGALRG